MHRIAAELETMIVELGVDARLLRLQLDEVYGEVDVTPGTAIAVVERFGELARLQRATVDELTSVMGVDHDLAASIKDTLDRLTETSILDQYS